MVWGKLLLTGLFGWGIHAARKDSQKNAEIKAEEARRRNTPCHFIDGISQDEFAQIARKAAKRIKRVISIDINGPFITGIACSQSGITTWSFTLDFNDYGHITGSYWHTAENVSSNIPNALGNSIQSAINAALSQCRKDSPKVFEDPDTSSKLEEKSFESAPDKARSHAKPKKRWKSIFLLSVIIFVALVIALSAAYRAWEESKLTYVGISSEAIKGEPYEVVLEKLESAGFTNINLDEVADLTVSEITHENLVQNITIDGDSYFGAISKYPYDTEIIITYHTLKHISLPLSSKDMKGEHYTDVISLLQNAGFVNIQTEVEYDLLLGWITKDGQVKAVTVDGDSKFNDSDTYRLDADIIITYHALKSTKNS